MKSIGVLIVWFGPLPNWFPFWLITAGMNESIDFHIVTDQTLTNMPSNVYVHPSTLEKESSRFSSYFSREITITRAYKFCDFKPMYGAVYQDILSEYDFWGESDIDLMYGDIRKFVTDEVLLKHQRIYEFGDFSLYRNCDEINNMFLNDGSIYTLDEALNPNINIAFDEYFGITRILDRHGVKSYSGVQDKAGILPMWEDRILICSGENYIRQLIYWHDGKVFQAYQGEDGDIVQKEFMLCHWQKKRPQLCFTPNETDSVGLTPRALIKLKGDCPTLEDLLKDDNSGLRHRAKYYVKKISNIVVMGTEQRRVYLRSVHERLRTRR